jgi:hypothetical protein
MGVRVDTTGHYQLTGSIYNFGVRCNEISAYFADLFTIYQEVGAKTAFMGNQRARFDKQHSYSALSPK